MILAAGRSGRMGQCKALLDIGGKTAVERIQEKLDEAGIHRQLVVTGHHAAEIESANPRSICIFNSDYDTGGMISSVKAGASALLGKCDGLLIALVDHPFVLAETMRYLIDAWILEPNKIVRPRYHERTGHPVVIPIAMADSILNLSSEATLKSWMMERMDKIRIVDVNDEGILVDLDTPVDYEKALRRCESLNV
jgi:CTP:molybdopterin cytidylyltransferase MocA